MVIGIVFALQIFKMLPPSVTGFLLLFAGGLTAGFFTRSTVMTGALAGTMVGCIVVAGMVMLVMHVGGPPGGILPIWSSVGAFALIISVFFVPSNTVSGIIGSVIRRWFRKEPLSSRILYNDSPMNERFQWIGIIGGSLIIAGSSFLIGSLNLLQIVPPLTAGFIAGFLSRGGIRNGAQSGLITAILGIGILAVPMFWLSSQATGFVAGLAGIVLIIVAVIAIPTAVVGGIIGAMVKRRIS
ncbi:MAG: DUF5518 domain-containing protein [Methanoregulaceae archaeon]|nr:DUF5518 domain-containing protein [Methanoregulaceae archaeon]